ncbi:phosphatidylinositol transfer protein [Aphelenchoides avenae]|nr:phosphatidylinositol transfer protein [Aphelenchus avenae]
MLIKEYRIPLPFTLEEYQRGQLYAVAESSQRETGGGEGVEVLEHRAFDSSSVRAGHHLCGTYTKKIYRVHSKAPYLFRRLLPPEAFVLHEECWNAYPYIKTVVTNPGYMNEKFRITVESIHCENDAGHLKNALNADREALARREVVLLDIANDSHLHKADLDEEGDVHAFRSQKSGRGPLNVGWIGQQHPIMCAYKLVTVYFKQWGLQNKVEKAIHCAYPRYCVRLNRQASYFV